MPAKSEIVTRYDGGIPCPVCGCNTKGCSLLDDGAQLCRGEPEDHTRWKIVAETGNDGFRLYRSASSRRGKSAKAAPLVNWSARAIHYHSKMDSRTRAQLAADLGGLPLEAFAAMPLVGTSGVTSAGVIATFAEVDEDGAVVGIVERDPSRPKKSQSLPGGVRGLTVPTGWDAPPGPVLVVEGATDVLACVGAGLCAVGRPGSEAKTELLAALLRKLPADRPVLVVGENDCKESGEWPGRDGAAKVAAALAGVLPNPVTWSLPPAGAKDSREWLTAAPDEWGARGQAYLAALMAAATPPSLPESPPDTPPHTPGAGATPVVVTLDDPDTWSKAPTNPHRLARQYLATLTPDGSPLRLRYWREEFYEWHAGGYQRIENDRMDGLIWDWLEAEFARIYTLAMRVYRTNADEAKKSGGVKGGGRRPVEEPVTRTLVANVLGALKGICQKGLSSAAQAPFWLDEVAGPSPSDLVACRNGLVNVATGETLPHTPSFFTVNVVPYDHDAAAPVPARWLKFLSEVWPDDPDSVATLQEWMGYLLTGDNSLQKMLFLFGEKRTGKGTVSRVIKKLVGEPNVTATSYRTLDGPFGLWPLLGKSVAVIGDSREARGDEIGPTAMERMLNITGQDDVLVDRKNLSMFSACLNLRFVVLSNDLPRVTDTSGAFVARVVLLHFRVSFLGREDAGLFDKLELELPGIFRWAVEGLRRLRRRGRFIQPASGAAKLQLVKAGSSPIGEFVGERCRVGDSYSVPCKDLLNAWIKWCEENNRDKPGTAQTLGIKLASVPGCANVERKRVRINGDLVWVYKGIKVRDFYDNGDDYPADSSDSGSVTVPDVPDLFLACKQGQEHQERYENKEKPTVVPEFLTKAVDPYIGNDQANDEQHEGSSTLMCGTDELGQELRNKSTEVLDEQADKVFLTCEQGQEQARNIRNSVQDFESELYFSDEMSLVTYPAGSATDVVQVGSTLHYRVTPSTVTYLIASVNAAPAGPDRDRLSAIMEPICDYLVRRYQPAEIEAAEKRGPIPLPRLPFTPST